MRPPVKRIDTYKRIKRDISQNIYPPGTFLPNEYDLAKIYGVGRKTIRGALSILAEEYRIKRERPRGTIVCDLKKHAKTNIIGIVGIENEKTESREIIREMEEYAAKFGYNVVNLECSQRFITDHPEYLIRFPADGLIFTASSIDTKVLEIIKERGIAVTGINRVCSLEQFDWMENDYSNGFPVALEHLLSLGHRKIAFIDFARTSEYQFFHDEIKQIMKSELGAAYNEDYFYARDTYYDLYRFFGKDFLRINCQRALEFLSKCKNVPTAFITCIAGARILKKMLSEKGFKVPNDFSILALSEEKIDDIEFTRLEFDRQKRLLWATKRLVDILLNGKNNIEHIYCKHELKIKNSTGKLRNKC